MHGQWHSFSEFCHSVKDSVLVIRWFFIPLAGCRCRCTPSPVPLSDRFSGGSSLIGPARMEPLPTPDDLADHALDELLVELYLVWGERGQIPKRLVLDIDATDVQLHGRQEHRFYHRYYHEYCYLPRLVFCNGWPVQTELRTSSGDVAAGVVETIEPLVDRLRKRLPHVPSLSEFTCMR